MAGPAVFNSVSIVSTSDDNFTRQSEDGVYKARHRDIWARPFEFVGI
jgi:hypothetical protein